MKSVFIIAIVAVAMIGVMVPSVFAQTSDYTITIIGTEGCEATWGCFDPFALWIPIGSTVEFYNPTDSMHYIGGYAGMELGMFGLEIPAGETMSIPFAFTEDGQVINYVDNLHPWEMGEIIVGESDYVPNNGSTRPNVTTALSLSEVASSKSDPITVPISKEIFERKKTDTISSILFAPGFSYHFSLERDFTSELGLTESYYQLYKIIDDKTTKRIGDLRFYLGSSEWWDNNASLQENDTSGFNNIFKVKFFIMHKGDSAVAQQISNNLSSALRVLVPEWSNEIGSTSDTWLMDSLNYSERNDQNKRENSIMTQEKEIKILHDDLDWGTITLIVTENADTIKIPSVSTDGMKILNQLLDEPTPTPEPIVEVASTSNCGTGTELVNGICQVVQTEEKSSKGGGCLIATATYGSELAPQVQQLRELRDNQLLNTESGTAFMGTFNDIYYSFSPMIADMERENPYFKEAVKLAITPMISTLSLMENANSESEVLGIGISVIMLNIGMYLGVPAVVVIGIRKALF